MSLLRNKNMWFSINEWLWMWFASVTPILLGSLFIKLYEDKLDYLSIVKGSIEPDIVFGFVATMIAPYLFMLGKLIGSKKYRREIQSVKFGGMCLFISVMIALVTTGVFSVSKGKQFQQTYHEETLILNEHNSEEMDIFLEVKEVSEVSPLKRLFDFWGSLTLSNQVLLVSYIFALFIWYYSIYLKNIEPPNIEEEGRERIDGYMGDVSQVVKGGE